MKKPIFEAKPQMIMQQRYFLAFVGLLLSFNVFAQSPVSFNADYLDAAPVIDVEPFDKDELEAEADRLAQYEGRAMDGKLREMDLDFFDLATHDIIDGGTEVYRLSFASAGAKSLAVYFDAFHLPVGAELYIYNADGTYFEGPYNWKENNDHKRFATNDIWGEQITLEYVQPAGVIGEPLLDVMAVGYFFQYVTNPADESTDRGGSQPCQVDVNCPEAQDWLCQKDAVVRLRIIDDGASFVCTGVLVNNTNLDCRQLLLSALHCADGVSDEDLLLLQVRFNYERPQDDDCGTGGFSSGRNRVGVFRLADSNDNGGGGFDGSDFILFEIEDDIPDTWNPYFAGWDARNQGSNSGVGIHHPSGDIKKISTYTTNLSSVSLGANGGSHWEVEWEPTVTDHGVTEPGSSGSPIFNSDQLVIGTLSAGFSACEPGGLGGGTGPNEPDFYGKMSWHWDNNPNPASEKLNLFLDPQGLATNGNEFLFGSYRPCEAASSCEAINVEESLLDPARVKLMPNPTSGVFFIRLNAQVNIRSVAIYDSSSRMVLQEAFNGPVKQFDFTDMPSGMYYVVVESEHGATFTQKLSKQ